jgi:hypothetical protein
VLARLILRNFQRVPGTTDDKTFPDIGDGYGLARSIDILQLLRVLIVSNWDCIELGRARTLIDLGCGDGVVLRVAQKIWIPTIIGIESDSQIARLAQINNPSALVINSKFEEWNVTGLELDRYIIYAFNPTEFKFLLIAINNILLQHEKCIAIVLKNIDEDLSGIKSNNKLK